MNPFPIKRYSLLKTAFPCTIPVLMGYLWIGIAFGLMLQDAGFGPLWAVFMSLTVYAGSAQFLGCSLLAQETSLLQIALLIGVLNIRHLFYGLSFLVPFQKAGRKKPYLIFSLTDETYALLTSVQPPPGVVPTDFYFAISLLNHLYWVAGSLLGAWIGAVLPFDTTGIDFAMTALFVVIALEQLPREKLSFRHAPVLIGFGCALVSLAVFGPDGMLIPALGAMTVLLLVVRPWVEREEAAR